MRNLSRHSGGGMALAVLTAVVAGCGSSENGTAGYGDNGEAAMVEMTSARAFSPREVTIRAGETVIWKNSSKDVHTVTADPMRAMKKENVSMPPGAKPFHSGDIQPGKTWRMTFPVAGTYKYVCTHHELQGMMGTVTVKPSADTGAPSPY